jgi:hypothetical protein
MEPLPFRGMQKYGEPFPDTPEMREYRERWLTRTLTLSSLPHLNSLDPELRRRRLVQGGEPLGGYNAVRPMPRQENDDDPGPGRVRHRCLFHPAEIS